VITALAMMLWIGVIAHRLGFPKDAGFSPPNFGTLSGMPCVRACLANADLERLARYPAERGTGI
jgi:hypothetical protein